MMDFTLKIYKKLLISFKEAGYNFYTLEAFVQEVQNNLNKDQKVLILRHDVDRKPENSLKTARIENSLNIYASYYFRIVKESFHTEIIKEIVALNHEIGYHYEDLAMANGNNEKAYRQFDINLKKFRNFFPVKTICMHGNPLSKWDNRLIWEKYNYRDHDIICEPYFDIDYNKVFYITDTGRRWDAQSVNVRDKVKKISQFRYSYKSTGDIIEALKNGVFPKVIILNSHPERWSDDLIPWIRQFVFQNIKNVIKKVLVKYRKNV